MLMADLFMVTFIILGFFLSLQGLWLTCRALWPARVERAGARAYGQRVRCVVAGAVVTGIMVALTAVSGAALGAFGQALAFGIVSLWILYASVGVAGLATQFGQKLGSTIEVDRPWRTTVRGGIALEMAFLFPILGWFILLPVSMLLGTGAVTLSWFDRSGRRKGSETTRTIEQGAGDTRSVDDEPAAHRREPVEALL